VGFYPFVPSGGGGGGGGGTLTEYLAPAVVALSFGASVAVNAALGNVFTLTLTSSAATIANPSSPVDGQMIQFRLAQNATGGYTVAWGAAYDFGSNAGVPNNPPALTAVASKTDILSFGYDAALTSWCYLGAAIPQGF
jgi:hypothetical protein